jgi:protein-S-isoprenylcysteine O-methyltransferase Ste14
MEWVVVFGSLLVAVGSIIIIWSIKQIRKNYYTPKSTRSTYNNKKVAKHRGDSLKEFRMFLESFSAGFAFIVIMGFVIGWKPEFSWIPSLMIGFIVGSLIAIQLIKREARSGNE